MWTETGGKKIEAQGSDKIKLKGKEINNISDKIARNGKNPKQGTHKTVRGSASNFWIYTLLRRMGCKKLSTFAELVDALNFTSCMPPLQWIWALYFLLRPEHAVHLTDQSLSSLAWNNWTQPSIIILAKAVAELWADSLQRVSKCPSWPMDITEAKQSSRKEITSSSSLLVKH